jgi:hypothetical protein
MTAIQLFNEILFIITFLVLIVTLIMIATVTLARYRIEVHQVGDNAARIERLETRFDACLSKKEEE